MKTILLAAINARYNQTNPAIRSIERFVGAKKPKVHLCSAEWTTSQPTLEITRGIADLFGNQTESSGQCLLLFSVYIWNATLVYQTAEAIRAAFPQIVIGMGGPEVSFQAPRLMTENPCIDFIMRGEGEETCAELAESFEQSDSNSLFLLSLKKITGVYFRDETEGSVEFSGERSPIKDLNTLPFIYTDTGKASGALSEDFIPAGRLTYYESSRGCPFQCSYCLSSLDTSVRYLPLERVLKEIDFFLRHEFRTIKFTDRTFNLDPERYLEIWRFIAENHNGITVFHFEIDAQYLCDEAFDVLRLLPPGAVQFEIGLQSTNRQTLREIRRSGNLEQIERNIRRIPDTIHVHLDLIAGLPHEDFASFQRSFAFAAALKPHMLQLGFLKVLKGTHMEQYIHETCKKGGEYAYAPFPPYEILRTPVLSYREISCLKDIELLLDIFYNSGHFQNTCAYVIHNLFNFLSDFAVFLDQKKQLQVQRTIVGNFSVLYEFSRTLEPDTAAVLEDLIRFDFMLNGKTGTFPAWFKRRYNKGAHDAALAATDFFTHEMRSGQFKRIHPPSARECYARSDYEQFLLNPLDPGLTSGPTAFLFLYPNRAEAAAANYSSRGRTTIVPQDMGFCAPLLKKPE